MISYLDIMSKQNSLDEIVSRWNSFDRPQTGSTYTHYKGGQYEIVATGFLEDSETPCVVYRSLEKNIVWVRTAKNFLEIIEYNGANVPRFTQSQ